MKDCPKCHRIYPDDSLSFCLDDGAVLTSSFNSGFADDAQTVVRLKVPAKKNFKPIIAVVGVAAGGLLLVLFVGVIIAAQWIFGSKKSNTKLNVDNQPITIKTPESQNFNPFTGSVESLLPSNISSGFDSFTLKNKLQPDNNWNEAQLDLGFTEIAIAVYDDSPPSKKQIKLVIMKYDSTAKLVDSFQRYCDGRKLTVDNKWKKGVIVGKRVQNERGIMWSNGSLMFFIQSTGGEDAFLAMFEESLPF